MDTLRLLALIFRPLEALEAALEPLAKAVEFEAVDAEALLAAGTLIKFGLFGGHLCTCLDLSVVPTFL